MAEAIGRFHWLVIDTVDPARIAPFWCRLLGVRERGWFGDDYLMLGLNAAAQILGMIPITPGGLGFVEAGLTATLALAGVSGGEAVLATLIYRLASYWLPMPSGLVAYLLFRRRYQTGKVARPVPAA